MTDESVKAMARAILAKMAADVAALLPDVSAYHAERHNEPAWQTALGLAQAAEKARPVGEVPEGWAEADIERAAKAWFYRHGVYEGYNAETKARMWNSSRESAIRQVRTILSCLSAAPSPPEGLGNKGFMADREVEKPTPVASDATPGKETVARIIANHMMDEYEWPRKPAESLGATLETLLDWTFSDGSLESQEKAPETSSVGDKQ